MSKRRLIMLAVVVSLVAVPLVATATYGDGPFSKNSPDIEFLGGGWSCSDGQKIDPVAAGTYNLDFKNQDGIIFNHAITLTVNPDKSIVFDTGHPSLRVQTVLVKGGPQAMLFNFRSGTQSATVHAPDNTKSKKIGDYYGVSNLCFLTDKK